jgi:hypothetical protein
MSVKVTDSPAKPIYAAAKRFVDEALRQDGSMFTSGKQIWSSVALSDFYERFVGQPEKLGKQCDRNMTAAGPQR